MPIIMDGDNRLSARSDMMRKEMSALKESFGSLNLVTTTRLLISFRRLKQCRFSHADLARFRKIVTDSALAAMACLGLSIINIIVL